MKKLPSYLLNLAGEYRVCSELNKRGLFATITYGTKKGVDVYAISDVIDKAIKIEVKTSQQKNFVTSLSQKSGADPNSLGFWRRIARDPKAPNFWVLCQIQTTEPNIYQERFFILSHAEICKVQAKRNRKYAKQYLKKHGKMPDFSKGVDNVIVDDVLEYENQWRKILNKMVLEE